MSDRFSKQRTESAKSWKFKGKRPLMKDEWIQWPTEFSYYDWQKLHAEYHKADEEQRIHSSNMTKNDKRNSTTSGLVNRSKYIDEYGKIDHDVIIDKKKEKVGHLIIHNALENFPPEEHKSLGQFYKDYMGYFSTDPHLKSNFTIRNDSKLNKYIDQYGKINRDVIDEMKKKLGRLIKDNALLNFTLVEHRLLDQIYINYIASIFYASQLKPNITQWKRNLTQLIMNMTKWKPYDSSFESYGNQSQPYSRLELYDMQLEPNNSQSESKPKVRRSIFKGNNTFINFLKSKLFPPKVENVKSSSPYPSQKQNKTDLDEILKFLRKKFSHLQSDKKEVVQNPLEYNISSANIENYSMDAKLESLHTINENEMYDNVAQNKSKINNEGSQKKEEINQTAAEVTTISANLDLNTNYNYSDMNGKLNVKSIDYSTGNYSMDATLESLHTVTNDEMYDHVAKNEDLINNEGSQKKEEINKSATEVTAINAKLDTATNYNYYDINGKLNVKSINDGAISTFKDYVEKNKSSKAILVVFESMLKANGTGNTEKSIENNLVNLISSTAINKNVSNTSSVNTEHIVGKKSFLKHLYQNTTSVAIQNANASEYFHEANMNKTDDFQNTTFNDDPTHSETAIKNTNLENLPSKSPKSEIEELNRTINYIVGAVVALYVVLIIVVSYALKIHKKMAFIFGIKKPDNESIVKETNKNIMELVEFGTDI